VNTSIESIDFLTVPEKDTAHPSHSEYFQYPFRMNKQGKWQREPASLIKEKIEHKPIQLVVLFGDML
jgi:hypothetical protein